MLQYVISVVHNVAPTGHWNLWSNDTIG